MNHRVPVAQTVADAEAQRFEPPTEFTDEWRELALTIDGYAIAEELGYDLMTWAPEGLGVLEGERPVAYTLLELRMLLYYVQRSEYFGGGYSDFSPIFDGIFSEMASVCGTHYKKLRKLTDKFDLLLTYSAVPEARKSAWCRKHGVSEADLAEWKREIEQNLTASQ